MSIIRKRYASTAALAFVIGLAAVAVLGGAARFLMRGQHSTGSAFSSLWNTTVKGQTTAYLLDEQGNINGLLLQTGDQLRFNPQTGEMVGAQVKIGDEVSATGHAGSRSTYGREIHIQQMTANDHTFIETANKPVPPHEAGGPREERGPHGHKPPPDAPIDAANTAPPNTAAETINASGTIATHLVNGHGDVDGLILNGGEQIRFSPEVGALITSAEKAGATNATVNVTGAGIRRDGRATVIRPTQFTIGNQTIALGR